MAVGLNETLTLQVAAGARLVPQVLLRMLKSPRRVTVIELRVVVATLVSMMVFPVVVVFSNWTPKLSPLGVNVSAAVPLAVSIEVGTPAATESGTNSRLMNGTGCFAGATPIRAKKMYTRKRASKIVRLMTGTSTRLGEPQPNREAAWDGVV